MTIFSNICILKIEETMLWVQISGSLENIKVIPMRSSAREEVSNKEMEQTAVNIVQNVSKLKPLIAHMLSLESTESYLFHILLFYNRVI